MHAYVHTSVLRGLNDVTGHNYPISFQAHGNNPLKVKLYSASESLREAFTSLITKLDYDTLYE